MKFTRSMFIRDLNDVISELGEVAKTLKGCRQKTLILSLLEEAQVHMTRVEAVKYANEGLYEIIDEIRELEVKLRELQKEG